MKQRIFSFGSVLQKSVKYPLQGLISWFDPAADTSCLYETETIQPKNPGKQEKTAPMFARKFGWR